MVIIMKFSSYLKGFKKIKEIFKIFVKINVAK